LEIRRILTIVDDNPNESGRPAMRVATAAAVKNPLVEGYDEDLQKLLDLGGSLGEVLAEKALKIVDNGQILSVAKAALLGTDSVLEHAAALLHHKFSASVSGLFGDVPELLPSTKAQGGPGSVISIPMDSASSGDAFEIRVQGSPQPDEIVVALALNCAAAPAVGKGDGSGDGSAGVAG
jgi:hypothetical protein